jgi:hypothetical protein
VSIFVYYYHGQNEFSIAIPPALGNLSWATLSILHSAMPEMCTKDDKIIATLCFRVSMFEYKLNEKLNIVW